MPITATITAFGSESTVPDNPEAVNAEIYVDDILIGSVTLMPHEAHGDDLDTWGTMENWAGQDVGAWLELQEDPFQASMEIVEAVREEVEKGDEGGR